MPQPPPPAAGQLWRLLSGHDSGQVLVWQVVQDHLIHLCVIHERSNAPVR
jgi:hypothetical protein